MAEKMQGKQVRIPPGLLMRLRNHVKERYGSEDARAHSLVIREALTEFLDRYESKNGKPGDVSQG